MTAPTAPAEWIMAERRDPKGIYGQGPTEYEVTVRLKGQCNYRLTEALIDHGVIPTPPEHVDSRPVTYHHDQEGFWATACFEQPLTPEEIREFQLQAQECLDWTLDEAQRLQKIRKAVLAAETPAGVR